MTSVYYAAEYFIFLVPISTDLLRVYYIVKKYFKGFVFLRNALVYSLFQNFSLLVVHHQNNASNSSRLFGL